jgi:hypothetical protein
MQPLHKASASLYSWLIHGLSNSASLSFNEAARIAKSGIYVVYNKGEAIYVGKTARTGSERLAELGSDYRSHTLNRKLTRQLLNRRHRLHIDTLNNNTKKELIANHALTREEFSSVQRDVRKRIKTRFSYRFITCSVKDLSRREHYTIAVFGPKYND